MLKSLTINNIVLIDKIALEFNDGFSVLTGETGSGKSILLDALGLIIGLRSNSKLIGRYDNKAHVIAEFCIAANLKCKKLLEENELINQNNPNEIIIRRTVSDSNNKIFINDISVSVNLLAIIGATLVEIHGQHQQYGLLNSNNHLQILDEFAQNQDDLRQINDIYYKLIEHDNKISDYYQSVENINREKEYLEYAINEIDNANIQEDEELKLSQKKEQLQNQNKITNFLKEIRNFLNESSLNIHHSQKTLSRNHNLINNYLGEFHSLLENLNDKNEKHLSETEDNLKNIDLILKNLNNNQETIEEIEERLFFIRNIARKYNCQSTEISNALINFQQKLQNIVLSTEDINKIQNDRQKLHEKYHNLAKKISQKRQLSAQKLSQKVEEELGFLKMAGTKFKVEILKNNLDKDTQISNEKIPTKILFKDYFLNGNEKVKFSASINNNNFDDIAKIASGGELSRFMLALKVALCEIKSVPTMIFDEIDAGISGSTSEAVGKRLRILSQNLQILVVTHQAQIAGKADNHLKVSKKITEDNISKTQINLLNHEEKIVEIARLFSGEIISDDAIGHARKMLNHFQD